MEKVGVYGTCWRHEEGRKAKALTVDECLIRNQDVSKEGVLIPLGKPALPIYIVGTCRSITDPLF